MANARLKLARVQGRKRRRSDADRAEPPSAEVPAQLRAPETPNCGREQPPTPASDDATGIHAALLERKRALETRLGELTVEKPLPRLEERGFDANGVRLQRTHRDFLLQEMEWMAADFAQERKWRLKTARTLAQSAQSHQSKKESRSARQEKMEEEARRRVAARVGREVKKFWTKIDKIISFKVKLQSDELRKAAMDRHLKNLVAQTERYASALADAFCEPQEPSAEEENLEEEKPMDAVVREEDHVGSDEGHDSDSDFQAQDEEDDETTIAAEEQQHSASRIEQEDEIAALQAESEMSLDELRAKYALAEETNDFHEEEQVSDEDTKMSTPSSDEDSDFADEDEMADDETTIEADEMTISQADVEDEVAHLQEESELSIEELKARYAAAFQDSVQSSVSDSEFNRKSSSDGNDEDMDDYQPSDAEEPDDETTLDVAERTEFTKEEVDEEVQLLQLESEMSIEELRAKYDAMASDVDDDERDRSSSRGDEDLEDQSDSDFHQNGTDEEDDETTIAEAEQAEHTTKDDANKEIADLEEEGNLSLDELRARYFGGQEEPQSNDRDEDDVVDTTDKEEHVENPEPTTLEEKSIQECDNEASEGDEDLVSYRRPYLLTSRLELREYQQAGVNWLTSMCEKRINGILADEMGLGKTIQTITMLAHLACVRGIWGPHLIVVPTSCMVNWEMEFKRWCPAFKVLTYFGSAKRRKELRHGWSKQNAFQVCITSYQLVVQDAHCFKRKKWYYLILDEAHNIKNWKSLRWQTLLHFNSQRRLLLTGTPLQNNIMELWSLMHFLMPHVFASRKEFTYWFQNPLSVMVEESTGKGTAGTDANGGVNGSDVMAAEQQQLVSQLHGIIRPFVLRRLKKDVAKQLPGKFEHVITCSLSKRQRFLYEDFISRSSTRRALFGSGKRGGGNFMSMMNVLMQLRKVCNHPDLFEPRPIESPLDMEALTLDVPTHCGFIFDWSEPSKFAWWPTEFILPNQELVQAEKHHRTRIRTLLRIYDDLNISEDLPDECSLTKKQASTFRSDALKRLLQLAESRRAYWLDKRKRFSDSAHLHAHIHEPMLGSDLIRASTMPVFISHAMEVHVKRARGEDLTRSEALSEIVPDPETRIEQLLPVIRKAVCVVPKARARPLLIRYGGKGFSNDSADPLKLSRKRRLQDCIDIQMKPIATRCINAYYEAFKRTQLFFPDKRLIQFDCGKLQQLDLLLRELKRGNHRCLIFTQMSSMLNILEIFLNLHGYTYFRLDGSTKVETRQYLMEKFNHDEKIFCFILSTRSGGLGINLTGADSVIFYDSDWNPAMDAQAQDRAHRIGQTRDVHIYRLVSEHTVEENILKKAQQKRHLDFLVMAKGEFTTEFFSKASLRELMGDLEKSDGDDEGDEDSKIEELVDGDDEDDDMSLDAIENAMAQLEDEDDMSLDAIENAMAQLEDEDDVVAMRGAREEFLTEQREFEEELGGAAASDKRRTSNAGTEASRASTPTVDGGNDDMEKDHEHHDEKQSFQPIDSSTASVVDDDEADRDSVQLADTQVENQENAEVQSVEEDTSMIDDEDDEVETVDGSDDDDGDRSDSELDSDDDMSDDKDVKQNSRANRPVRGANKKRRRADSSRPGPNTKRAKTKAEVAIVSAAQEQKKMERAKEKARELEEERKLQAWKDSVSSLQNFEDSLNPVDRYALHFREDVDPLFAYVPTAEAFDRLEDEASLMLNIEEIEARKMIEEQQWIDDGELIAGVDGLEELAPAEIEMHYQLYKKERSNVHAARRQRQLTGDAWELKKCAITGQPFYYNTDTREATWDKPTVWIKNEQCATARELGFAGLPTNVLLLIFGKLRAYPDRLSGVQLVCRSWRDVALHQSLSIRVNASDFFNLHGDLSRRDHWKELVDGVERGETLLFGSGVYEIHDVVEITKPIRLLAAHDAHVELQMATPQAQLKWTARGGLICGFHISRRHSASLHTGEAACNWQHLLHVTKRGYVRAVFNDFDGNHQGNSCLAVSGDPHSLLVAQHNRIFHAGSGSGVMLLQGALVMQRNSIFQNAHSGITVWSGNAVLRRNQVFSNKRFGIRLLYHANNVVIEENKVENHPCGNIDVENSGRRFVVRWNEMVKDEVDDLPHNHGSLKLITSRVEERVLKVEKPVQPVKRLPKEVVVAIPAATASGLGVTAYSRALAAAFAPPLAGELPRSSMSLVTSPYVKTPTVASVVTTPSPLPPVVPQVKSEPAVATAASAAVPPPSVPALSQDKATTVAGITLVSSTAAAALPVKIKRKRKPKTEKVLVHGVEIVFKDTCEKKGDKKVKKPRRMATDGAKNIKTESAASTPNATSSIVPDVAPSDKEPTSESLSAVRPHLPTKEDPAPESPANPIVPEVPASEP